MATVLDTPESAKTLADRLKQLGNIPADRIRARPAPGTATEKDVTELADRENRLCELVDGVLVEKTAGLRESLLAVALAELLRKLARKRREYFQAGVRLAWFIDPSARTVAVYTSAERVQLYAEDSVLSGESVLPGLEIALKALFAELDRTA